LRGPYFALATIAAGEIFRLIATNWESLTDGMVGILIIQTFRSKLPYYYLALALAAASLLVFELVMKSKLGFYFVSIREDQDAAESLGINATLYKNISLLPSLHFNHGHSGGNYRRGCHYLGPGCGRLYHDWYSGNLSERSLWVGTQVGQRVSRSCLWATGNLCDPFHGQRGCGRLA
jgi:branched-chain amino acid transport system permease protein